MKRCSWRQTLVAASATVVAAVAAGQSYDGAGLLVALVGSLG